MTKTTPYQIIILQAVKHCNLHKYFHISLFNPYLKKFYDHIVWFNHQPSIFKQLEHACHDKESTDYPLKTNITLNGQIITLNVPKYTHTEYTDLSKHQICTSCLEYKSECTCYIEPDHKHIADLNSGKL